MVVADGILTNVLVSKGIAQEGNPFLFELAGNPELIILKIGGVILSVIILWDIQRRYPRLAFWTTLVFTVFYTFIVVWNANLLILGS